MFGDYRYVYAWPETHPWIERVLAAFHYCNGEGDPHTECKRLGDAIAKHPIDVAFVGIGENGHLALTIRRRTF